MSSHNKRKLTDWFSAALHTKRKGEILGGP